MIVSWDAFFCRVGLVHHHVPVPLLFHEIPSHSGRESWNLNKICVKNNRKARGREKKNDKIRS